MGRAERRREARRGRSASPGSPPAFPHRARAAAAAGSCLEEARRRLERRLAEEPFHDEARHDLGVVLLRDGQAAAAADHFRAVIARRPSHPGARLNLALALCELGDEGAWDAATCAASLSPRSAAAQAALGHALAMRGDLEGADAAYGRSLSLDGAPASVVGRRADVLRRLGRFRDSLACIAPLADRSPGDLAVQAEKLLLLRALGSPAADRQRGRLVALAASAPLDLGAFCHVLAADGRDEDAMALADAAVEGSPAVAYFLANRASLLHGRNRMAEALADLKRALELDPADTEVLLSIGRLFQQFDQPAAAAPFFLQILEHRPDSAEAYGRLAAVRGACGDLRESTALLRHALMLEPGYHPLMASLCWTRMLACDWDGLDGEVGAVLQRHLADGVAFPPFILLARGMPAPEFLLWTRAWAEKMVGSRPPLAPRRPPSPQGARIRLGYLSADFKDHATLLLIRELFELHDRGRFEVFGYNIGPIDESPRCLRAIRTLDRFVDLVGFRDAEAARRIAADGIDVLIDLKGYTQDGRPGILGHRPAPVQVNYLGYPGSLGTRAVDYMIADAVVVPDEHRSLYDEAVVHLPNSYQPNDRGRAGADPAARREDHGLPAAGFVFCCFNSNYKITPLFFDLWMRLLRGIPGAVLWLLSTNNQVEGNLRRAARARGIDDGRLVFAPRVAFEDHVGRLGLADLFLDTLPVCAHTTASDALWAGVPVLTCLGPHFAGRVGASLLRAMGLPELVTASLADYEREALALAREPARLGALRDRLAANRLAAPLFDTPRYVANFEAALETMVRRASDGLPPAPFTVREGRGEDVAAPSRDEAGATGRRGACAP